MKKRILITGSAGFLGYHLAFLLHDNYEVGGTYHNNKASVHPIPMYEVDITRPEEVSNAFEEFNPDYVIHSAASADVDWSEHHPEIADAVNRVGSRNVAEVSKKLGARVIHISTDLVFDGKKGDYVETDPVNPTSVYGKSKVAAEKSVMGISDDNIVFRVALMFGPDSPFKPGYVFSTMNNIRQGKPARFFADQWRTPLYTADVANAIEQVIENNPVGGIYHISGAEKLSRYEFGLRMQKVYGFDKELVLKSTMDDVPDMTFRSRDVSLIHGKAAEKFGYRPTPLDEALKNIIV